MFNKKRLSRRIKQNEGYSEKVYLDQLEKLTIGYGHLITKKERFEKNKKYPKKTLTKIFNNDLDRAIENYEKLFQKHKLPTGAEEVVIEMIFQLGTKRFLRFKKAVKALKDKNFLKASDEILDSKMYKQVPKRVTIYVNILKKQI